MSKIIKAAQLRVIVAEDESMIVRSRETTNGKATNEYNSSGVLLQAERVIDDANSKAKEIMEKATKDREALLQAANQEASELLAEARLEAEKLQIHSKEAGWESGHQEGYDEGLRAAKEAVEKKATSLFGILEKTIRQAKADQAKRLGLLEEDFLKLSVLLAEKIIRREISEDPRWLKPIISEAISRLESAEKITVRLHPADFSEFQQAKKEFDFRGEIRLESDESLTPGSCLIDSEYGGIDARLEQRLGKLANGLMDVMYDE